MSAATELRQFLLDQETIAIDQVAQNYVPEEYISSAGFIFFARRSTEHARTFAQATGDPDSLYYDLEVYHRDPDIVETVADTVQQLDCYNGPFGLTGRVQGVFVDTQTDDYVPRVQFTDEEIFFSSFLSIEIRAFSE